MLLRNLDFKGGLCNGTRLMVRALHNNYIDGEVLTGVSAGNRVFVPRVQLAPSDSNLPFTLKHRQFPVRLAYSMTINKSQGQTFDKVGVYLKKPCFSHGQLYVACSRTKSFNSLFFKVDKHALQVYIMLFPCLKSGVTWPSQVEEKKKREKNLIVFGIPESNNLNELEKNNDDKKIINMIFEEIGKGNEKPIKIIRIKNKKDTKTPLPIIAVLPENCERNKVLLASRELR
ncbi:uncharacterized protein LOC136093445 [Hydra vulgaris]|uniref:uncharacterized protein LOC136093445 n=1 Tax=Hydra vulgaris TaxID=6087 RepID=UPI0032E9CB18